METLYEVQSSDPAQMVWSDVVAEYRKIKEMLKDGRKWSNNYINALDQRMYTLVNFMAEVAAERTY